MRVSEGGRLVDARWTLGGRLTARTYAGWTQWTLKVRLVQTHRTF